MSASNPIDLTQDNDSDNNSAALVFVSMRPVPEVSFSKFTWFPKLPVELRLVILAMYIEDLPSQTLSFDDNIVVSRAFRRKGKRASNKGKLPSSLQVNRECRQQTLQQKSYCILWAAIHDGPWFSLQNVVEARMIPFNPTKDVLALSFFSIICTRDLFDVPDDICWILNSAYEFYSTHTDQGFTYNEYLQTHSDDGIEQYDAQLSNTLSSLSKVRHLELVANDSRVQNADVFKRVKIIKRGLSRWFTGLDSITINNPDGYYFNGGVFVNIRKALLDYFEERKEINTEIKVPQIWLERRGVPSI